MSDLHAVADRSEIEALHGEFTDAVMMRDFERLASLFTEDGVVRIPDVDEAVSRDGIRAEVERLQGLWDDLAQPTRPGTIRLEDDAAVGRAYALELGHRSSPLSYSVYHDRYRRTPDGWKFSERVYEVIYVDTSPLTATASARGA